MVNLIWKDIILMRSDEVYLIKKDIVYSRTGRSKVIKFKDLNIKDVEFSKLINVY